MYGTVTLEALDRALVARGEALGVAVDTFQSNHEGALVDRLQEALGTHRGVLLNPGGLTHTSVVLRDAVSAVALPTVEVHLTHIDAREPFRRVSRVAPVCVARVAGFGAHGYLLALEGLVARLRAAPFPPAGTIG